MWRIMMNLPINANIEPDISGLNTFINTEIDLIEAHQKQCQHVLADYAINFLDKVFPLTTGSHKDVSSYVVYYHHLLAFFPDGTQAGLASTKQFVGLCGHKEQPEALLLKAEEQYVEITFNRKGRIGNANPANIEDIQIEVCSQDLQKQRRWFSMLHINRNMSPSEQIDNGKDFNLEAKMFTLTNGESFSL